MRVVIANKAVPLLAVTPWQINAQLPQGVPAGTATFQVRDAHGAMLPPLGVTIESFAPVNFSNPLVQGRPYYPQAAYHAGPGVPADMDHPVSAGETIEIYGLGLGVSEPVVEAGLASPSSPPVRAVQTRRLQVGGRDAAVTFAGLAPGFAGVYPVNAVVPVGLAPGVAAIWRRGELLVGGSEVKQGRAPGGADQGQSYIRGRIRFAELLLNAGCSWNPVREYDLEGDAGYRGVAPTSAELRISLPGSYGWI